MHYQEHTTRNHLGKNRIVICSLTTITKVARSSYTGDAVFDRIRLSPILSPGVISRWRHQMETFSALLAICAGNSPVPVKSPHKGQWRGALMFSLTCARINDWVNNREAGDLRRHRGHYDVNVMESRTPLKQEFRAKRKLEKNSIMMRRVVCIGGHWEQNRYCSSYITVWKWHAIFWRKYLVLARKVILKITKSLYAFCMCYLHTIFQHSRWQN